MNPDKKKPEFVRQDIHKRKGLEFKWRSPSGIDSKLRLGMKGHRKRPSPGYGSPRKLRGLLKGGIRGVAVDSISDLDRIEPGKDGAILSSTLGKRKKVDIVKECLSRKIKIINMRDSEGFLKSVDDFISSKKKESKKEKTAKKEPKKEDLSEKVMTEEDKKAGEKKEKDKLLTKKDAL
ncbi:hypothetical protein HY638_05270 [Candidatus Woesearchaeota archaeon]|nr:hypothetical protein [Candidatus Woesearchaeota archaeon]